MLLLYTDGILRRPQRQKEEFGQQRLESLLRNSEADTGSVVRNILGAHNEFAANGRENRRPHDICAMRTL